MSPLWPDIALARAARAKAEEAGLVVEAKGNPRAVEKPTTSRRPPRRILYPRVSSIAL